MMPSGGTAGQVLKKSSGDDFDCAWENEAGGGGGGVDTSGSPVANDFARFTDADTIEGRSASETLSDIGAAASVHTHAASAINSGTLADARVAQSNVTQHQAALSIAESQISDLQSYLTSITPVHTLVFEGTLPAAHNTNTNADIPWNDATEHADVTHTDGDAAINLDVAGEYDIYFNVEVTNGAANNRQTWAVDLRHRNSSDVEQFTYVMSAGSYIRDDAATYDSGLCAGHFNIVVSAGDDVTLQTRVLDAQTGAGVNNADTTATYLRIFRKTYT